MKKLFFCLLFCASFIASYDFHEYTAYGCSEPALEACFNNWQQSAFNPVCGQTINPSFPGNPQWYWNDCVRRACNKPVTTGCTLPYKYGIAGPAYNLCPTDATAVVSCLSTQPYQPVCGTTSTANLVTPYFNSCMVQACGKQLTFPTGDCQGLPFTPPTPVITSAVAQPNPVQTSQVLTYNINWQYFDAGNKKLLVCSTGFLNGINCRDNTLCTSSIVLATPSCTSLAPSIIGTYTYSAFICYDMGVCSAAKPMSFQVVSAPSPPTLNSLIAQPNPVQVGQSVSFTGSWSNPSGAGVSFKVCGTNQLTASGDCVSSTICSSTGLNNPASCSLVAPTAGSYPLYGFVCDLSNPSKCSTSKSVTVVVNPPIPPGGGIPDCAKNPGTVTFGNVGSDIYRGDLFTIDTTFSCTPAQITQYVDHVLFKAKKTDAGSTLTGQVNLKKNANGIEFSRPFATGAKVQVPDPNNPDCTCSINPADPNYRPSCNPSRCTLIDTPDYKLPTGAYNIEVDVFYADGSSQKVYGGNFNVKYDSQCNAVLDTTLSGFNENHLDVVYVHDNGLTSGNNFDYIKNTALNWQSTDPFGLQYFSTQHKVNVWKVQSNLQDVCSDVAPNGNPDAVDINKNCNMPAILSSASHCPTQTGGVGVSIMTDRNFLPNGLAGGPMAFSTNYFDGLGWFGYSTGYYHWLGFSAFGLKQELVLTSGGNDLGANCKSSFSYSPYYVASYPAMKTMTTSDNGGLGTVANFYPNYLQFIASNPDPGPNKDPNYPYLVYARCFVEDCTKHAEWLSTFYSGCSYVEPNKRPSVNSNMHVWGDLNYFSYFLYYYGYSSYSFFNSHPWGETGSQIVDNVMRGYS